MFKIRRYLFSLSLSISLILALSVLLLLFSRSSLSVLFCHCSSVTLVLQVCFFLFWSIHYQGQISAQGILHLQNPNSEPNSGNRFWTPEFWTRILGSNDLILFFKQKRPPEKFTLQNSPPKIHLSKFNPEIEQNNSHCTSAGPFGWFIIFPPSYLICFLSPFFCQHCSFSCVFCRSFGLALVQSSLFFLGLPV